jgi:hypothetical protein
MKMVRSVRVNSNKKLLLRNNDTVVAKAEVLLRQT